MSTTPFRVGFVRQTDKHTLEAQKASMKRAGITKIYTDLALCIRHRRKGERDVVAVHKGMLLADPSDKRRLGGVRGSFWRNLDKLEAAGAVLWEVATNRSTATKRERDLITREAVDDLARTRRYDRAGRPPREWAPSDLAIMRLHWFSREHATNKDAIRAMASDGLHVTESMVLKKIGKSGRSPGPKATRRYRSGDVKPDEIAIGAYYKHLKSGGTYQVLMFATIEATMTEAVVYAARAKDGVRRWVRPLDEFCDGRFVPVDMTPSQPKPVSE